MMAEDILEQEDKEQEVIEKEVATSTTATVPPAVEANNDKQQAPNLVCPTSVLLDYSSLEETIKQFACPHCQHNRCYVVKPDSYKTL